MDDFVDEANEERNNGAIDSLKRLVHQINEHISSINVLSEVVLIRMGEVDELIASHPGIVEYAQAHDALTHLLENVLKVAEECLEKRNVLIHDSRTADHGGPLTFSPNVQSTSSSVEEVRFQC